MNRMRAAFLRLMGLFGQTRRDAGFAAELESHLQLHVDVDPIAALRAE